MQQKTGLQVLAGQVADLLTEEDIRAEAPSFYESSIEYRIPDVDMRRRAWHILNQHGLWVMFNGVNGLIVKLG